MRKHASDRVKFLNQATIERLLGDDNCYSQSSGEYDEQALKDRLIELKQAKAERQGSKGYDEMLVDEKAQQSGYAPMVMTARVNRYVKPVRGVQDVKTVKRQYKFIIRW